MIEFCYDCHKEIWECKKEKHELDMSKKPAFCMGCKQWKPVVKLKKGSPEMTASGLSRGQGPKDI